MSLVLLMPSVLNLDLRNGNPYKDSGVCPVGCWSLALLAKSKLVSENALDPSATIAGASAGYGIIGTSDGSFYIWELATGTKLGCLSHCKGATMSCLTADDSDSGAFAVAVDGSQLQGACANGGFQFGLSARSACHEMRFKVLIFKGWCWRRFQAEKVP